MIQSVPRHKLPAVTARPRLLDIDPASAETARTVDRALMVSTTPARTTRPVAFNSAI